MHLSTLLDQLHRWFWSYRRFLTKKCLRPHFLNAVSRGLSRLVRGVEVVGCREEPYEETRRNIDVLQQVVLCLSVEIRLDEQLDVMFQTRSILFSFRRSIGSTHVVDPHAVCGFGTKHDIRVDVLEFVHNICASANVTNNGVHQECHVVKRLTGDSSMEHVCGAIALSTLLVPRRRQLLVDASHVLLLRCHLVVCLLVCLLVV